MTSYRLRPLVLAALLLALGACAMSSEPPREPPAGSTMAEILESAPASAWRALDQDHALYLEIPTGRVVIELAPQFAPAHVANIEQLVAQQYFDGLAIIRSQDNYVVQWGDPAEDKRSLDAARASLEAEFDRPGAELSFTPLGSVDAYAPEVGFSRGMPVARDPERERTWLAHCYGMVGAGRDMASDSGNGAELYVVIGHAPRHLDRNVTLVGRVVDGIEALSVLPRGTGPLGFYEDPAEYVEINSIRLGSALPPEQRADLEIMRTDSQSFEQLIDARRWRREEWFLDKVGAVELCNVPLPVRERP